MFLTLLQKYWFVLFYFPEQLQTPDPVDTVQFSVLLRKGTKQAYKEVAVSADSDIARNLQKQEEADRLEKERVKKLTLEMNERQEEEDLNDAIATVIFKEKVVTVSLTLTFIFESVKINVTCLKQ